MSTAGFSGTPLVKKLGIKEGLSCKIKNPPDHYKDLLLGLPPIKESAPYDFIQIFVQYFEELPQAFLLKDDLKKDGMLWISWPKGKSELPKNINENDIRSYGLKSGLVDVKVCAIDDDWSGLKFMYRRTDR